MNRVLLTQLERVVLLFVLYLLAGVTGSAVAYRLLALGQTGPDYGPLVLSIGLLVALVGCIVLVRGRENVPLFPLPPWVPGPGTTLLVLGILPIVAVLFRPGAYGTGTPVVATAPARDSAAPRTLSSSAYLPVADTGLAPLAASPAVTEPEPVPVNPATAAMVPSPRRSFAPAAYEPEEPPTSYNPAARFPVPTRYASPVTATSSDVSWAERLRRRVLRDNYQPSATEMSRYRRVRDSLQQNTGNLSLSGGMGQGQSTQQPQQQPAPQPVNSRRYDPFEEVPTDVPAGEPVRGSFGNTAPDTTGP